MDYQVSARKYRPGTFDDVIGQPHVVQTLMNAVSTKRIAHAYLFSGTRGVGKTTVARILAKALNCEQGPTGRPCDRCANCLEIAQGSSVDVVEIDGASNTSVDDVREIRENVKFTPFRGQYRVYIIDEVHMLSNSAFNALLKTLEEPPAHVVFIFATTENHKIPATILSRCQHYNIRRIARAEIIERLRHVAKQDQLTIEERSFLALARASEGSMRDALSLLDQAIAFGGKTIHHPDLEALLGAVPHELVQGIVKAVMTQESSAALTVLANLLDQGHDLRAFCDNVVEQIRNLLVASVVPATAELHSLIEASEEDIKQLATDAKTLTPEQLQELLTLFIQAEDSLRLSAHPRFVLETAAIRATRLLRGRDTGDPRLFQTAPAPTGQKSPVRSEAIDSRSAAASTTPSVATSAPSGRTDQTASQPQSKPVSLSQPKLGERPMPQRPPDQPTPKEAAATPIAATAPLPHLSPTVAQTPVVANSMLFTRFEITAAIFSWPPSLAPTLFKLDPVAALTPAMWPFIIIFLFMVFFDTVGTLVGVAEQAGLMRGNQLPRARQAFVSDATATVAGACLGTSTVTSYIESATGVEQGGRTGLTALTVAVLFLVAPFFSPVIEMLGGYAPITAPALVLVGAMMLRNVAQLAWQDYTELLPSFLVLLGIPLSYSIADGLALGFISYAEAFELAQAVRARAIAPGAEFAAIASEVSEAGTKGQGGLLGTVRRGDLAPALEAQAFNLPVGEVGTPIEAEYGYHLLKVESRTDDARQPFDEVKETIRKEIWSRRYRERYGEFMKRAWEEAEIWDSPKYAAKLSNP